MPLRDFLPKKPTKADEAASEANVAFFKALDEFQKAQGRQLAAIVVHDNKGSHVEFTAVPYPTSGGS